MSSAWKVLQKQWGGKTKSPKRGGKNKNHALVAGGVRQTGHNRKLGAGESFKSTVRSYHPQARDEELPMSAETRFCQLDVLNGANQHMNLQARTPKQRRADRSHDKRQVHRAYMWRTPEALGTETNVRSRILAVCREPGHFRKRKKEGWGPASRAKSIHLRRILLRQAYLWP